MNTRRHIGRHLHMPVHQSSYAQSNVSCTLGGTELQLRRGSEPREHQMLLASVLLCNLHPILPRYLRSAGTVLGLTEISLHPPLCFAVFVNSSSATLCYPSLLWQIRTGMTSFGMSHHVGTKDKTLTPFRFPGAFFAGCLWGVAVKE